MAVRVLSLFAGIGGFDVGLERTSAFRTVAFCEIDPDARRVLTKHWPEVPCYEDVRELSAERLAAAGIAVDCIVGGFPCQDISLAGRMAGADGEKSGLWREVIRLVADLRPRLIILENSPVLRSRGLEVMLGELCALGYDAEWHCIPANAIDAPHRRDRLWIISYPTGERDGLPPLEIRAGWDQLEHRAWWHSEPGLGGGLDGFSVWLDKYEPFLKDRERYAEEENYRFGTGEALRLLREADVAEANAEQPDRGQGGISEKAVLLAYLWKLAAESEEQEHLQPKGSPLSEGSVRGMPSAHCPSRPSCRPGHNEQHGGEHPDPLQAVPRFLAQHAETAWLDYRRSDACPKVAWAAGIAATVDGLSAQPHRLRLLGNAVVPQIPELIGRAILASLAEERKAA